MRPLAAAALAAVAVAILAVAGPDSKPARPAAAQAVVDQPATPSSPQPTASQPSVVQPARRAIRWQLAAEAGTSQRPPGRTFTPELERQLTTRPPRPAPGQSHARLVRIRETQDVPGARRVLVTVQRGRDRSQVTLIAVCRRRCLIASIE